MKSKFQFYKNIILLVASALTLVAVTFAWFSVSYDNEVSLIETTVGGDIIDVDFYIADEEENYSPLGGDIVLSDFVAGSYNKYMMVVTTKTSDPLKMNFGIVGLPETLNAELGDSVNIKYTLMTAKESVTAEGEVSYRGDAEISKSEDYVALSALEDGVIFKDILLTNYQSSSTDKFVIYYEIGLSENSPSSIGGLTSDLGSVKVSAQRVG
ncbi:MAG: hypothetical protein IJC13_04655 [Clostridia bacterium]|nr:hypothetical protein [Clostridia bacterium]